MKVRYLPAALSDIDGIRQYLMERNPWAAARILTAIRSAIERLGENPRLGHRGRVPDAYEGVVRRTPYIVAYQVDIQSDELVVLAVFHGAQDRRE